MAKLTLEHIGKYYGAVEALKDISLDIADGEFIVLVGPSGCGKSTLLRCIAGLERLNSGHIVLGGRSVEHVVTRDRNVAMVFQSYALFPHLTVAENIAFGMHIRKVNRPEVARRVTQAAELLGLAPLVGRYPRELSGGQRQRVAMGRAIVRDPEVFLFDEPLSNLDAKLRVQMRTEIKALRQRLGVTSVYVTHDQDEAMTLADRIVVMNAGRIEQIGTPMDLYDRPDNVFVAGFMGSPPMNFIATLAVVHGSDKMLKTAGGHLLRVGALPAGIDEVVLGLRPEALRFEADGPLTGLVEVVEPQGAQSLIFVRLDGSEMIYVAADKRTTLVPGEQVRLGFDPADSHLFETSTGRSLRPRPIEEAAG